MKNIFLLNILFILLSFLTGCGVEKPQFTIINIGSSECNACNEMKDNLKQVSFEYRNKVKIIFYDIESPDGKTKYQEYQGKSIPFTIFFNQNGKKFFLTNSKIEKDAIIAILKAEGLK